MAELLKDSTIFAKLDLEVMRGFSSKYAFSLYEAISRRLRQRYVFTEELSISELRELLGVEPNKLTAYKSLKARAIDPAVEEVNAIAPFDVTLQPRVSGRKVISYILGWNIKTEGRLRDAYKELHYSRVGRKERLTGASEVIPDNPATS
jgi:plasmid replication initiation protein